MPDRYFSHWKKALEKRKTEGTFRFLRPKYEGIDFCSNDYLGLARNKDFQQLLLKKVSDHPELLSGSTGSRLISGNSPVVTETEEYIAKQHDYPAALLFPSGYNANLALFSTLPGRFDTIIIDEQIHRSVHDACTMSNAKKIKFKHNDLTSLEEKLQRQNGQCFIAIESLYSMEGDIAPIQEIAQLAEKYSAGLFVDEAHAFGVFGYGLVTEYQLQDKVMATVITYGKALGSHGATILSNELIKSFLINFATPFIYTTSAQDFQWSAIKTGYEFLNYHPKLKENLQRNISHFTKHGLDSPSAENSPVQAIIVPDNQRLKALQQNLSENGFLTYAVYSPTVKEGTERLRICLHSFNTQEEIEKLCETIKRSGN
ncbi:aminotransferase class I/II-fold pyridoxal phosphate-dependent enzyme [Chryseobacterium populi]|uniref:7-keto-8-aminopelargonate synthetase-like enzyme n=1 Tax=Chryseobacterium populi TaxID=1144316 RepID=J2KS42_9FLAO|nr:pyridoxal phosphate-dependent aminotransferase family protein [Chryseobacterium populi]EJL75873.1 7-keto-8-aminopelargonate synthetase-like enzyme [Chryseobacterium populi]